MVCSSTYCQEIPCTRAVGRLHKIVQIKVSARQGLLVEQGIHRPRLQRDRLRGPDSRCCAVQYLCNSIHQMGAFDRCPTRACVGKAAVLGESVGIDSGDSSLHLADPA